MAESWLELTAKRQGIPPDVLRERSKRKLVGCVIKALESITGAQATEQEWKLRLTQVVASESDRGGSKQFENDVKQVETLIKDIILSKSPIGQVLEGRGISSRRCCLDELQQIIERGDDVLSLGIIKSGNTIQAHAAHLGYRDGFGLILKSDGDRPISLRPGALLNVIVFSK